MVFANGIKKLKYNLLLHTGIIVFFFYYPLFFSAIKIVSYLKREKG